MIESIYRYKTMHKIYSIFTNTQAEKQIKIPSITVHNTKIKIPKQHYNTYKNVPTKQVTQHAEITLTKITITTKSSISYKYMKLPKRIIITMYIIIINIIA